MNRKKKGNFEEVDYQIVCYYDQKQAMHVAYALNHPGASATGTTEEEAIEECINLILEWELDDPIEKGNC